jgi:predicted Zn-dependent protease
MKYVVRHIEENENVSESSEFSYGLRIIFRVVLLVLLAYAMLGLLVDHAVPHIPVSLEDRLAGPIMSEVSSGLDVPEGFDVTVIQELLDSLAALMDGPRRQFRVSILEKDEANALALPGGHIVIFSQLLQKVESENELAMILAHELGHFAARDHLRGVGRSFLFYILASVMLGGDSSSARTLMNSSGILQNNYSRTQEYAADRFALQLLVKRYGHAGGATDFFARLATKEKLPQLVHYLSTHPASDRRIAALKQLIAENGYQVSGVLPAGWLRAEENSDNSAKAQND